MFETSLLKKTKQLWKLYVGDAGLYIGALGLFYIISIANKLSANTGIFWSLFFLSLGICGFFFPILAIKCPNCKQHWYWLAVNKSPAIWRTWLARLPACPQCLATFDVGKVQMTDEMTFKTNSAFKSVTYDKDADSWYFVFSNRISFNVTAFWRLLKNKQIRFVSLDHGHQFGLPKPENLIEKLTEELTGKSLLEIEIKQDTADLLLNLTDNVQIEIFISSSGYETYNFSINTKSYIGMGSGDIAIYDDKRNQSS